MPYFCSLKATFQNSTLMKNFQFLLSFLFTIISITAFSQENPTGGKVKVSGKITDKATGQPLEYTTVTLLNQQNPSSVSGGMTDTKGEFSFDINPGTYTIKIEFISFKPVEIKDKSITQNLNLGTISLAEDATILNEVEIRQERSTVEIKLDKKVYNVGQDMIVKGGTVSDVLDNVPSVSVDVEGNVSLRGNESVKILIDGKPSGLGGINIADALKLIPADAIDKVEVITNPSARYDAEGGGGILNIILKKGKNQGVNGTVTATTGYPANHGITGTVNYKTEKFNLFTTQGYSYRKNPGNSLTNTEYLDQFTGATKSYIDERRNNERMNKSYNANLGLEWFLNKSTTWTNTVSYRKSAGENPDQVFQYKYDAARQFESFVDRYNFEDSDDEDIEFSTNLIKKFKKDGHQLMVDASYSTSNDNDLSSITNDEFDASNTNILSEQQRTFNIQDQRRRLLQADYVLPLGKKSQFEAGYRGSFTDLTTDYTVENLDGGNWQTDYTFTNALQYVEKVNALYSSFGTKVKKFSYLFGLRWEDSNIEINQFTDQVFRTKKYNNFFPSAFVAYEFSETSSMSFSYSRRISRPRSRSINPFSSLSSNINMFRGNPDLDPSMSDAFDIGYLKKWSKVTFNTSAYFNRTHDAEQFVRNTEIIEIDGTPREILVSTPVNIGRQDRFGFEFTLSYNPYRWWKLNGNFNLFRNQTIGSYNYTDLNDQLQTIDYSNTAYSWFARINSKISLPWGIDWQTNATYNAPQTNAQGKSRGIIAANLAFAKDVLKDKATIALNVSDLFNSRKRISDTYLLTQNAYSEMQWRERQINLSFTYRFNKKKGEKDKQPKRENGNDDGDFQG